MKIGTYYYPEQWPREQWERDFDNIARMGLQIVHMGEFAWFDMEPEPGNYQLDWLSDCVEMARKRKMDVILCTPTAAPPVWLTEKHPEILPLEADGTRGRFGGRRHYSPTAPAMIEASQRIVAALAERFGDHPSVIGWQIDNEFGLHFDQNDHAHQAFRAWLKRKYETIDNLNRAWGCQFWNTYYTSFEQILLPPKRNPEYRNPHECLDASRFWSWAFAHFAKVQADILKPKVGNRFITTNFMPFHPDCDPADMADALTLFSWDSYPVSGHGRNIKGYTYRMGNPAQIGFTHDQMASYNGRWGLMELQPGQVNWSGVPVLLYPGTVRLWIWTAFAHGAEFVTTYRYRQPRFGIELFHHGLVGTDGVSPTPGGRDFMHAIEEMKKLKLSGSTQNPPLDCNTTIGLVFDFDQLWYYETLSQARRWKQSEFLMRWYAAVMRLGLCVKILDPRKPYPSDLQLVIAPGLQMTSEPEVRHMRDYVAGGGHLLLTCRTALMDRTGQLWEGPTAAPILDLIGGTIEAYDGLPDETWGHVELLDEKEHEWGVWGDLLYAEPDTKVLGRYSDRFYEGAAAILQKRHPRGVVTYCGVNGEQGLCDALVERVAKQTKLAIQELPERTQLLKRGNYWIFLNYQDQTLQAPAPKKAHFLVGTRTVEPAGVAVWEET